MTDSHAPSRRTVLAALTAGGVLATTGTARAASRVPDELRPGGEFDRYLTQLAEEEKFAGTVLLTHRGKPVLRRSHHLADRARGIRNSQDTIFTLGSITKVFTALAIAQLAEQGKIGYSRKAGEYVDFLRPEVAEVTVHQLITHTSGLADFHSPAYFDAARHWHMVEEFWDGTLGFVRECPLTFAPGAGYAYSNAGYVVLGAIVGQVSAGRPGPHYYDYVRHNVFARADMTDADFVTRPEWMADRRMAHPYTKNEAGEWVDNIAGSPFTGTPAGGSFATARDLAAFAKAVQENRLLTAPFTQLFTSPKVPHAPNNSWWGAYGLGSFLSNGQWTLGHNGANTAGASCNLEWFPATDWAAVVLGNGGFRTADPIANKLRELITR